MPDDTYNGWTNYETWNVKLWIDNEEPSYKLWREITKNAWSRRTELTISANVHFDSPIIPERAAVRRALANMLQDHYESAADKLTGITGTFTDLMTHALARVNWTEIADSMIDSHLEDLDR